MSGSAVHPQLQAVLEEFVSAQDRLHRLAARVPQESWSRRVDPDRWSVAECVAHLNLTSRAFIPLIHGALAAGEAQRRGPRRYRRDPVGWMLWKTTGPPVRNRLKTTAPFVPNLTAGKDELIAEFVRLQEEQMACTRKANGVDLGSLRITSPFNSRVRYNLYSCLTILPRHQHRHLWQAEQVLEAMARTA